MRAFAVGENACAHALWGQRKQY